MWLPECKICIQNALWATPPNMYSIRGDLFRDAREWAELVKLVRDLKPETLTGYLQHDSPGKAKEANWLPAPKGPFVAIMRLYWPKAEALDGTWKLPPLTRVE